MFSCWANLTFLFKSSFCRAVPIMGKWCHGTHLDLTVVDVIAGPSELPSVDLSNYLSSSVIETKSFEQPTRPSSAQFRAVSVEQRPFLSYIGEWLRVTGTAWSQEMHCTSYPPRPEITKVTYRPILAIGNNVYCDISLVDAGCVWLCHLLHASVYHQQYCECSRTIRYGTLFPPRKHGKNADTGLMKIFVKFYDNFFISSRNYPAGRLWCSR